MPSDSKIKYHYDQEVPTKSAGEYEFYRWFATDWRRAGFTMTAQTVKDFLKRLDILPHRVLEVGPGPGTWTEMLVKELGNISFDLVDISTVMLDAARKRFQPKTNFRFFETDFSLFAADTSYDVFFSSRAFEYFPNQIEAIKKIAGLLNPGGEGLIITKTPHYWREGMRGRQSPERHRGQISPRVLRRLLLKNGFIIKDLRVATVTVPWLKSAKINFWVFAILSRLPFNFLTEQLTESYAIHFQKRVTLELCGLPGSGKSTLSRKLANQGWARIKVGNPFKLLFYNLIFCFKYPQICWSLILALGRERGGPSGLFYYKFMNLFFQSNAKWIIAQRVVRSVIDQGHFQICLSLFEREVSMEEMFQLASILPAPTELLVLNLRPEYRVARLNRRGHLPRGHFGSRYAAEWERVTALNYQTFLAVLPRLGLPKVTIVNDHEDKIRR